MLLTGHDLTQFELVVLGYEFPQGEANEFDANWLMVRISAKPLDDPSWEATEPCLLTWEVAGLARWLGSLASWPPAETEEGFVEPLLYFVAVEGSADLVRIRVYFELEARPTWAFSRVAGMHDLWMDLELGPEDLRSAADSLRDDLSRFPPRPGCRNADD